jgi:F-type H+-transporting ATPase subunit b
MISTMVRWAAAVAVAVLVGAGGPALADKGHPPETPGEQVKAAAKEAAKEAVDDAAHSGGGTAFIDLPARWDLTVYTLIVFVLLFLFLSKFAWPSIQEGLVNRENAIAAARDEVQKALRDAEELRAKLAADMAAAQDKIRGLIEEARRDADALRQKEREAGVKDAQEERERAKREIVAAKDAALKEIYDSSVNLATAMSAKTIARQITADDHRRLLDESLAELSAAVKASA